LAAYILKRLLLILPTLFGILIINFLVVQLAPGGPIEQVVAELTGQEQAATARISGSGEIAGAAAGEEGGASARRHPRGVDPELIADLEEQFGLDKPLHERFFMMAWDYIRFDFGTSYFKERPVTELVLERLPVSISLGLWTLLITYFISIPLGIAKAVRDGSAFDVWSSALIFVGYAVPGFLFAIFLIVVFAGGMFLDLFPLRGLVSNNWEELSLIGKILDYFWHLALPLFALIVCQFAILTMLTKNSFLEEVSKQYVMTARAKGISERRVLYRHVFRNAMLIIIGGFPQAFINVLFTGALLIEVIFSLDGLGLLGYEAVIKRDYPIFFGTLFMFTLVGLVAQLIGDITYTLVDPRIDFESREV